MTRRCIVRPLAQADIDAAATWHERQQSGLGSRFLDVLDRVFERICNTSSQFPTIAVGVRRALLPTFPYAVNFREKEHAILILAVLHLPRDSLMWRRRT
jgi:plasmid stabilization system protein ParE